jgi:hypothetical protein
MSDGGSWQELDYNGVYVDYALTRPVSIISTLIVMTEQHVI